MAKMTTWAKKRASLALACLLFACPTATVAQETWREDENKPTFAPYPVMPPSVTNDFKASATLSAPEQPAPAPPTPSPTPTPPQHSEPSGGPSVNDSGGSSVSDDLSNDEKFHLWLRELEREAIALGVSPTTAQDALRNRVLVERVIELDQKQPEKTATFEAYQARILSPDRIAKGRRLYAEHASLLQEITGRYGVPASVIVALWGVESAFGKNVGSFNILDSLATLAFDGRRASFFRKELIEALRLLDEERRPASMMIGSWAGAMGQCQFMPSTFRRYAVDYNRDGLRDIWNDTPDVFASIANYLAAEGWRNGLVWGREVDTETIPSDSRAGLDSQKPLSEWNGLGARGLDGTGLPVRNISSALIQPDGPDGRSFLVTDNYRALMRWNRSTYFATAVGLLADRIAQ